MNKTTGYAIQHRDGSHVAVAVEGVGAGRWRLVQREDSTAGALPSGLVRDLDRAPERLNLLVGEEDVTTTVASFPKLGRRELPRAVAGWVARQEKGAPDEWSVSWRPVGSGPAGKDGKQDVALAYARRDWLAAQQTTVVDLGLKPGIILPPSLLLDQFFRLAGPDRDTIGTWNLVFVGGETNVLCVSNQDSLILTRPLPSDLSQGSEREEYLNRLTTEVERSVFFARQNAGNAEVDRLFVCGDPDLATALVARLGEASDVPAEHWPLTEAIDLGVHDVGPDEQLLIVAAALATTSPAFNLAEATRRSLLSPALRRRLLVAVSAAAVALVPVLIVGGLVTSRVQKHYLNRAQDELSVASERAAAAAVVYQRERVLQAREDYLANYIDTRHDLADVLMRLAAATPAEVVFRDLHVVQRDGGVFLYVTGQSIAQTVTQAQQGFMRFHAELDRSRDVRPLGEPRQLRIAEIEEEGRSEKAVLFSLDCELLIATDREEG